MTPGVGPSSASSATPGPAASTSRTPGSPTRASSICSWRSQPSPSHGPHAPRLPSWDQARPGAKPMAGSPNPGFEPASIRSDDSCDMTPQPPWTPGPGSTQNRQNGRESCSVVGGSSPSSATKEFKGLARDRQAFRLVYSHSAQRPLAWKHKLI
jgi:hypothetical protein